MLGAVAQCNPKLKTSSTLNQISLGSITRIDISHNSLNFLPPEIFAMCSLLYLNAAQNKIERLPSPDQCSYNSPVLEEIYLQDNSLEEILPEIFRMPSLVTLDISNNKIEKIPFDMWKAPKLRELNIAFNLIKDLPTSEDVSFKIGFFFPNFNRFLIYVLEQFTGYFQIQIVGIKINFTSISVSSITLENSSKMSILIEDNSIYLQ